jgi:hypothetical protein
MAARYVSRKYTKLASRRAAFGHHP